MSGKATKKKDEPNITPDKLRECVTFITLTPKQRKFILEYLKDYNGHQAAVRAGYSKATALSQASQMLSKLKITTAIREVSEIIESKDIADVEEIREFLTGIMRGRITDICSFTENGLVFNKSSNEMSPAATKLIKKIKVTEKTSQTDNILETKTEIELHDPVRASELLGKSHGMFTEKVEHSGEVNGKIEVEFVK